MSEVIRITGLEGAQARLQAIGRAFPLATSRGMRDGAEHLRAFMTDTYLSGQRLKVRTGRLRSGWTVRDLQESGKVGAVVATRVKYAPIQEYGFTGVEHVKEHLRRIDPQKAKRRAGRERSRLAKLGTRGKVIARQQAKVKRQSQTAAAHRGDTDLATRRAMGRRGTRTWANAAGLRAMKLVQRRARGIQGGVAERASEGLSMRAQALNAGLSDKAKAMGKGFQTVRAHDRWMRIRAKRYAQDTIRNAGSRALQIAIERIRKEALSA